jgi:hypothetical protein
VKSQKIILHTFSENSEPSTLNYWQKFFLSIKPIINGIKRGFGILTTARAPETIGESNAMRLNIYLELPCQVVNKPSRQLKLDLILSSPLEKLS